MVKNLNWWVANHLATLKKWAKHLNTGLTRTIEHVDRVVLELGASPLHVHLNHSTKLPFPFHALDEKTDLPL